MFYVPIENAISDESVIKPLPQVAIQDNPNWNKSNWGPPISATDYSAIHLELFYPPKFEPIYMPTSIVRSQGTANMPEVCPYSDVLLRNHWETFNTTSGKGYGGNDQYSIHNIPACKERNQNYMNIKDATNTFARLYVNDADKDLVWTYDGHSRSFAKQTPRYITEREMNIHL